jgi:DNA-binding winged helix-turn-helix (wHTH) protein
VPLHFVFSNFEIDEARFELRRAGEPVHVQPKVLDLIVYLAAHRERVVTKEELLDTVWRGVAVTEASLIQAVSLARRALDDSPNDQRVIRTVRNKGFQFVAQAGSAPRARNDREAPPPARRADQAGITALETEEDRSARSARAGRAPHLFAVLDCEVPAYGAASWSLADVDEVHIVRGSEHRAKRSSTSMSRVLTLTVPGRFMSRQHARIVRTPLEWLVTDEESRNGTFVNGERIDRRRTLEPNDIVECGRMLYRFTTEPSFTGVSADLGAKDGLVPTVTPAVASLSRDLERVAPSAMSILILGEAGVGKTNVAHAIHRLSARSGPLVTLADDANVIEKAHHGTLVVENLERISAPALQALKAVIDAPAPTVRVIATSTLTVQELASRVPTDLLARISGFRCTLPPLRDRPGDLGVLIAHILDRRASANQEIEIAAGRALVAHSWPGNLHELARTFELAEVLSHGGAIGLAHLPVELRNQALLLSSHSEIETAVRRPS